MQVEEQDFKEFLTISQGLAVNSIRTYLIRFKIIKVWLKNNNLELNKHSVSKFLYFLKIEKKLSNEAINTYRNTLIHLEAFCKFHDLPTGFTEGTRNLPKIKSDILYLSQEEIEKLLVTKLEFANRNGVDCSNLDEKYLILTHFLYITGCRFNEAASLRIKDINIGNGEAILLQTKNGENRHIYFPSKKLKENLANLVANRDSGDFVFTGSTGKKMLDGTFNEVLKRRAKKAGLIKADEIHAHTLRHTFATQLFSGGTDITVVSKLLGHKDIQVTFETYIHIADSTLRNAVKSLPSLRNEREPVERLQEAVNLIEGLNFAKDNRFSYQVNQTNNSISLQISF